MCLNSVQPSQPTGSFLRIRLPSQEPRGPSSSCSGAPLCVEAKGRLFLAAPLPLPLTNRAGKRNRPPFIPSVLPGHGWLLLSGPPAGHLMYEVSRWKGRKGWQVHQKLAPACTASTAAQQTLTSCAPAPSAWSLPSSAWVFLALARSLSPNPFLFIYSLFLVYCGEVYITENVLW